VLGKTLGVPLFQEQAMRVAIEGAGFTPNEADQLRRAMATFKHAGGVSAFREKLISGMRERHYPQDFAERIFKQLEGFGSYGFPESHAASFAKIAYASSWMKCHHPDVFCAALLNAQPMGFYAPAQIVRDARQHGVEVRPVDINASRWDCTLEAVEGSKLHAVRLGLRMVRGLANKPGATIVAVRGDKAYASIEELQRRSGVAVAALERLADADAFRAALGLSRREAIWAIRALSDAPLPLFAAAESGAEILPEPAVALRPMTAGREVVEDYAAMGLTLRRHPVAFLRVDLAAQAIVSCAAAVGARDGRWVRTAGLILVRQRPGTSSGVIFITIEDETGVANLVVWPKIYERYRRIVLTARMIAARGRIQREGEVVHLIVEELRDLSELLRSVGEREDGFSLPHGRGDQVTHGGRPDSRETLGRKPRTLLIPDRKREAGIRPATRDFH
jgi:error-prone DNA polymerase